VFRTTDLRAVRIAAKDLDAAVHAFRDAFGFEETSGGGDAAAGTRSRTLRIGPAEIRFATSSSEVSPLGRFLSERGPGLESIVLEVDDLEKAARTLAERSAPFREGRDERGGRALELAPSETHGVPLILVGRATR
jgi:methylmalonyl-CoA/ethylmalonyl-CoA epimerase